MGRRNKRKGQKSPKKLYMVEMDVSPDQSDDNFFHDHSILKSTVDTVNPSSAEAAAADHNFYPNSKAYQWVEKCDKLEEEMEEMKRKLVYLENKIADNSDFPQYDCANPIVELFLEEMKETRKNLDVSKRQYVSILTQRQEELGKEMSLDKDNTWKMDNKSILLQQEIMSIKRERHLLQQEIKCIKRERHLVLSLAPLFGNECSIQMIYEEDPDIFEGDTVTMENVTVIQVEPQAQAVVNYVHVMMAPQEMVVEAMEDQCLDVTSFQWIQPLYIPQKQVMITATGNAVKCKHIDEVNNLESVCNPASGGADDFSRRSADLTVCNPASGGADDFSRRSTDLTVGNPASGGADVGNKSLVHSATLSHHIMGDDENFFNLAQGCVPLSRSHGDHTKWEVGGCLALQLPGCPLMLVHWSTTTINYILPLKPWWYEWILIYMAIRNLVQQHDPG